MVKIKIGIEVHVQLLTKTKLFCGCPNVMTKEPNTNVCECCLGFPGSKPVLNSKAVEHGLKIIMALNCEVPGEMFFSRKSYFYPDMSKNFQITQYEIPIGSNGFLKVNDKKIKITRVNLEEDPARVQHKSLSGESSITKADYMLVDYNRSGTPLCEIVTDPDFSSPKEVRLFLTELSSILRYLGVFDPDIEGSMRVDANISLGKEDGASGVRVEVKNISGFKDVEKALNYEIVRQKNAARRGKKIEMETRSWDAVVGVTRSLRSKEGEEDYGYIFEGDLPKITITKERMKSIEMPEFADQKIKRYKKQYGIAEELSAAITSEPELAEVFEKVAGKVNVDLAARWFAGEIKKTLNYSNLNIKDTKITVDSIIKLLKKIESSEITERAAELMLREMIKKAPEEIKGDFSVIEGGSLEPLIKSVLSENPKAILDYKSGKSEAFNFLVGQVMHKTKGRASPDAVRNLLKKML